jgi:soluble lytic murein transglycosylase-like protein
MSIPSIDDNLLRILAASNKNTAATASGFDAALSAAASQGNIESAAQSAAALATALHLELLRSVATLGDDSDDEVPDLGALEQALTSQGTAPPAAAPIAAAPPMAAVSAYRQEDGLDGIIARASQRYQVAPQLIKAVIRAESGFDAKAVSPAGAQGLMQLMPTTAAALGVSDPFDAEQNVMGGTRYLRQLLDKYNGRLDTALAAYNWGPGHVDQRTGSLPHETRNYIDRIHGYLVGNVG